MEDETRQCVECQQFYGTSATDFKCSSCFKKAEPEGIAKLGASGASPANRRTTRIGSDPKPPPFGSVEEAVQAVVHEEVKQEEE